MAEIKENVRTAEELSGLMSLLKSLSEKTRLEGEGYYSGEKDYGNDWSGSRAGISGRVLTEIPLMDYILNLMARGYGYRNQVTSPENNQEIRSRGKIMGGEVGITDRQGRYVGLDYNRNSPRRFMFRGKFPISLLSGGNRGVLPR
mgnify:FL=1|tara:strand:+ start:123 stop:557 length:435 start_codon:yes stop_codon:yes gene_type:complete